VALFAAGAFGSAAAAAGLCYLAWGQNFWYWAVTVLGHHPVVPLRSVQHLLDSWIYFAVLLLGGLALLRADRLDRWTGVWVVALGLITVETYTSGVAWMLNHIGPGSLLAGCWLLVGLERIAMASRPAVGSATARWFQSGAVAALIGLTFAGLGVVRVPAPTLSPDTERYAAEIEREFVGMPAAEVLLDVGQWVYLPDRVIMRDRGATSGEAGYTGTADFSGMLARIGGKHYRRILLRDYDSPEFMYDHGDWAKSSGIRSALNANYQVVRRIEAVQGPRDSPWFKTISVLEPRPPATAGH
jgi:hypothetical protein